MNELIIDDSNADQFTQGVVVDGEEKGFGLVPRDYERHPVGSYSGIEPFRIPVIPRSEWPERIKQMEESQSRLSDIRMIGNNGRMIPSTDQGSAPLCWAHSPVSAALVTRALENQTYARLSAFGVGCKIGGIDRRGNFNLRGGWNPEASEFLMNYGCPSTATWPEKSTARSNDNANTWEEASHFKLTEGWFDLHMSKYDRNLTFDELMTSLMLRVACPVDYNWWGHSVCALDPVDVEPSRSLDDSNRWGVRIWNSWRDSWGTNGMAVLRGRKAVPDGATALKNLTLRG